MIATALPPTLTKLMHDGSLADALSQCAAALRKKPDAREQQLLRFDLLCVKGAWERARQQLESCARLDASLLPHMTVNMALIQGEEAREAVFAGAQTPHIFTDTDIHTNTDTADMPAPPAHDTWASFLVQALREQGLGHLDQADALREKALSMAPECSGHVEGAELSASFSWITDSDTRLGPMLEAFVQDQYVWIPFDRVRRIEQRPPLTVRDFIWQAARIELASGPIHAFLPARYPGSGAAEDPLALGRETRWSDVGQTGVFGLGQKVWCTDAGDLPVCDVRTLTCAAFAGFETEAKA